MFSLFKKKSDEIPSAASAAPVVFSEPQLPEAAPMLTWRDRLRQGLSRTGKNLAGMFGTIKVDEAYFEELENALLLADVGVTASAELIERLKLEARRERIEDGTTLKRALAGLMTQMLQPLEKALPLGRAQPLVIMVAGVNGAGKTTSIGKLAKYFQAQGKTVMLAAGDTFRAAAREQLKIWGERNGVTVVAQEGGDAAAVMFDAYQSAKARQIDILIADTAGRLPTQIHLMEEIKKVKRVLGKAEAAAPHEVLLVLDGNTGQNAIAQVKAFDDALGLTGLIITKLDGTAKGGVIAAIGKARPIPLYFIGIGEGLDDLRPFVAREFVDALVGD